MRTLKLQIQVSADGFIADKNGNTGWMLWNWGSEWGWDDELREYFIRLKSTVDCVLLSRKMAQEGFIDHWKRVADDRDSPQAAFAEKITAAHKVVFSRTLKESVWENTAIAGPDIIREVSRLKHLPGKDIIVYGGASFVSSLIEAALIDEYYLFVNPTAIGRGLQIFHEQTPLTLVSSRPFPSGIVVTKYIPAW
jgi:dihydrofolate reductase